MKTHFIEATQRDDFNWGKFLLCQYEPADWAHPVHLPISKSLASQPQSLLRSRMRDPDGIWCLDIETNEGAYLRWGPRMHLDLNDKHQVWVCPMYEPFLEWLGSQHELGDITMLPHFLRLDTDFGAVAGYRRSGKQQQEG